MHQKKETLKEMPNCKKNALTSQFCHGHGQCGDQSGQKGRDNIFVKNLKWWQSKAVIF